MVIQAAVEDMPTELARRLRLGELAGGLEMTEGPEEAAARPGWWLSAGSFMIERYRTDAGRHSIGIAGNNTGNRMGRGETWGHRWRPS